MYGCTEHRIDIGVSYDELGKSLGIATSFRDITTGFARRVDFSHPYHELHVVFQPTPTGNTRAYVPKYMPRRIAERVVNDWARRKINS